MLIVIANVGFGVDNEHLWKQGCFFCAMGIGGG